MKPSLNKKYSSGRMSFPMLVWSLKFQILFVVWLLVVGSWSVNRSWDRTAFAANLLQDYPAQNEDGTMNSVIEIPAGTNEKWEFSTEKGEILLQMIDDKPRIIKYLGYPGNYGMVPQTVLSKEHGGDGDPLDILVIGGPLKRGDVVKVKLIGVLRFLDRGEQDDKLIAVLPGTALESVNNFDELNTSFPGVLDIITIWFKNYKGPGKMEFLGNGSVEKANEILTAAAADYPNTDKGPASP